MAEASSLWKFQHPLGVQEYDLALMTWEEVEGHISYLSFEERKNVRRSYDQVILLHEKKSTHKNYRELHSIIQHSFTLFTALADLKADPETLMSGMLLHLCLHGWISEEEALTHMSKNASLLPSLFAVFNAYETSMQSGLRMLCLHGQCDPRVWVFVLVERLEHVLSLPLECKDARHRMVLEDTSSTLVPLARKLSMDVLARDLMMHCVERLDSARFHAVCIAEATTETFVRSIIAEMSSVLSAHCPTWVLAKDRTNRCTELDPPKEGEAPRAVPMTLTCDTQDDCYRALALLHRHWRQKPGSFYDAMSQPDAQGLESLCTTVLLYNGTRVRLAIRTKQMHDYAEWGVATLCFQKEMCGYRGFFPWMYILDALLEDVTLSDEMFASHVSRNVLCSHILVYGAGGEVAFVPAHATCLDAAFALFGEEVLSLFSLMVDGVPQQLQKTITAGQTISYTRSGERTVMRRWVKYCTTHRAETSIRAALRQAPSEHTVSLGKEALQKILTDHQKGFLDEFDEESFLESLLSMGYQSLEEVYAAIGDGSEDPINIYVALFEPQKRSAYPKMLLTGELVRGNSAIMTRLMNVYESHQPHVSNVTVLSRFWNKKRNIVRMSIAAPMQLRRRIETELQEAGLERIRTRSAMSTVWQYIAIGLIVVIWGIDPVLAAHLLQGPLNIHPIDFTIMRFAGFFSLCFVYASIVRMRSSFGYRSLPWNNLYLWASAASLVMIALTTYYALLYLLPQDYIAFSYASAVAIPVSISFLSNPFSKTSIFPVALIASAFIVYPMLPSQLTIASFIAGIMMFLSFTAFTFFVDTFKRRNAVGARLHTFFLLLSILSLVMSLPLIPFSTVFDVGYHTPILFLYGIFVSGIPYVLYYNVLKTGVMPWFMKFFVLGVVCTLGSQFALFNVINVWSLIPLSLVCFAVFLFYRTYRYPTGRSS